MIGRLSLVPILTLGIIAISAMTMYSVWLLTYALGPFWHGIVSLLAWIVGFGVGTVAFWKAIETLSRRTIGRRTVS